MTTAGAVPPLPRAIAGDVRHEAVVRALAADPRPLWRAGRLAVAHVGWTPALAAAVALAMRRSQLTLGLEAAASALGAEQAGLGALARRGEAHGARVSRLLVVAEGAAERFYRQAERLLLAHAPRLLGLAVAADPDVLGRTLLGREREVKGVLVAHRDAVAAVLLALV